MRANRKTGTRPEALLRSTLHRRGLRFRKGILVAAGDVNVRPDIVFTKARVAAFLDGCFWHACPLHGTRPVANAAYWRAKFRRNVERDRLVDEALLRAGWRVVRVWEHDLRADIEGSAGMVAAAVTSGVE